MTTPLLFIASLLQACECWFNFEAEKPAEETRRKNVSIFSMRSRWPEREAVVVSLLAGWLAVGKQTG